MDIDKNKKLTENKKVNHNMKKLISVSTAIKLATITLFNDYKILKRI